MSENLPAPNGGEAMDRKTLLAVVTAGDLSALTDEQRTQYYLWRCEAAGLDPRSTPFQYLELNRRTVLYATKGATDQLALKHRLTVAITARERAEDLYIVTVRAQDPTGRYTEDVGVVVIAGLRGEALANALMKGVSKAKRRAVLSLVGLGMMDETEADDQGPNLSPLLPPAPTVDTTTGEVLAQPPPKREPAPAAVSGWTDEDERAHLAMKTASGFLFAQADDAGIDTKDAEAMRRLCGKVLGRTVPLVRELDAADRAIVAQAIQADPAAAYLLAHPPGEETTDPPTLLSVQAAETQPSYSGLIQ